MRRKKYQLLRDAGYSSSDATKYKDLSYDKVLDLVASYKLNPGDQVVVNASLNEYNHYELKGIVVDNNSDNSDIYYINIHVDKPIVLAFSRSELTKLWVIIIKIVGLNITLF